MTVEATQQGASEEVTQEQKIDPRVEAMNDIIAANRAEREELVDDSVQEAVEPQQVAAPEAIVENEYTGPTESELAALAKHGLEYRDGKVGLKIKVDGQEDFAPIDSVRAAKQIETAARRKMTEADEVIRRAQQIEHEISRKEQELRQREAQISSVNKTSETQQIAKKFAEAIYSGEEGEVAAAIQELMAGRAPSTTQGLTPEQVNQIVQQNLASYQQQARIMSAQESVATAEDAFNREYEDINSDADKRLLWEHHVKERVQANVATGRNEPILEVMKSVGNEIRTKFAPTNGSRLQRAEPSLPSIGGKNVTRPQTPEEQPKSRDDVIAMMRKSRGQFV